MKQSLDSSANAARQKQNIQWEKRASFLLPLLWSKEDFCPKDFLYIYKNLLQVENQQVTQSDSARERKDTDLSPGCL